MAYRISYISLPDPLLQSVANLHGFAGMLVFAMTDSYCSQVWRQATLWDKTEKPVRVEEFTFRGAIPCRSITAIAITGFVQRRLAYLGRLQKSGLYR